MSKEIYDPFERAITHQTDRLSWLYTHFIRSLEGYTSEGVVPFAKEVILDNIIQVSLPDFSLYRPHVRKVIMDSSWVDSRLPEGHYRIPAKEIPRAQQVLDTYGSVNRIRLSSGMSYTGYDGYGTDSMFDGYMDALYDEELGVDLNFFFNHPDIIWTSPALKGLDQLPILLAHQHKPDLSSMSPQVFSEFRPLAVIDFRILVKTQYGDVVARTSYGDIPMGETEMFSGLEDKRTELIAKYQNTMMTNIPELIAGV